MCGGCAADHLNDPYPILTRKGNFSAAAVLGRKKAMCSLGALAAGAAEQEAPMNPSNNSLKINPGCLVARREVDQSDPKLLWLWWLAGFV